jgi:hypothetical protein
MMGNQKRNTIPSLHRQHIPGNDQPLDFGFAGTFREARL